MPGPRQGTWFLGLLGSNGRQMEVVSSLPASWRREGASGAKETESDTPAVKGLQ